MKLLPKRIVYLELLDSLLDWDGGSSRVRYRMRRDFPWTLDEEWGIERWGLRNARRRSAGTTVPLRGWTLPFRAFPRVLSPVLVWATQFILTLRRPRAGIMVAYSPLMGAGVAAAGLFRRSSVLVVRIIESSSTKARLVYGRPSEARLLAAIERFVLRRANLVLPMSPFTNQIARGAGVSGERILDVPFPTRWFGAEITSQEEEGPLRVVFVGRLVPEKGLDVLIRAFAQVAQGFPDAILDVAGDGPEREALELLAKRLDAAEQVRFQGWLAAEEMPRFLQGALIAVMPSRVEEGLGMALIEAGLAGCALIGSDLGGIRNVVEPGQTGVLLPPDDPSALVEALKWLLRDPGEARRMGAEARRRSHDYIRARESALQTLQQRLETLRGA